MHESPRAAAGARTFVQMVGVAPKSVQGTRVPRHRPGGHAEAGLQKRRWPPGVPHLVYVSVSPVSPMARIPRPCAPTSSPAPRQRKRFADAWPRVACPQRSCVLAVLGPGHRWPFAAVPLMTLAAWVRSTSGSADGLVTRGTFKRCHAACHRPSAEQTFTSSTWRAFARSAVCPIFEADRRMTRSDADNGA